MWARVLFHKHCTSINPSRHITSRTCQNVKNGCQVCSKATRWVVHKGDKINFNGDSWIPGMESLRSLISGPVNQGYEGLKVGTFYSESHWDITSISFDFPEDVVSTIESTFVNTNSVNLDKMVWNLTDNGLISTKTTCALIGRLNHHQVQNSGKDFDWEWGQKLSNKIKYFLWLLTHARLPTTQYLHSRGYEPKPHVLLRWQGGRNHRTPTLQMWQCYPILVDACWAKPFRP